MANKVRIAVEVIGALALIASLVFNINTWQETQKSKSPHFTAASQTQYDESDGSLSDVIEAYNWQGEPKELRTQIHTLMFIDTYNVGEKGLASRQSAYVRLQGYFGPVPAITNIRDKLFTIKGGFPKFRAVQHYFIQAAYKDGYVSTFEVERFLQFDYRDEKDKYCHQYFAFVNYIGAVPIDETTIGNRLNIADNNFSRAASKGLILYVDKLNGSQLWDWYKSEFLR